MFLLSETKHIKRLDGYFLQHCAVIDSNHLSLVMRNINDTAEHDSLEERSVRKRVIKIHLADNNIESASFTISNAEAIFATHAGRDKTDALFLNGNGEVYLFTDSLQEENSIYESIGVSEDDFLLFGVASINDLVYACGLNGLVTRRIANNTWQDLSIPAQLFSSLPRTMVKVDGFAPDDLYAVSWKAGLFHFNGQKWKNVPFPSNILLESVCCGGDGVVYVSGQAGTLFAGRGSRWREVHAGSFTLPYTDMIWHDNTLWCTSDYGVWTFADNRLERAPVPDEVYFCSGHLSAKDGLLLLGGMNGAAIHDGSRWQVLYFQPEIFEGMES